MSKMMRAKKEEENGGEGSSEAVKTGRKQDIRTQYTQTTAH